MAAITAGLVKELRERTGLGMMDCKKALVAAEGDIEKAIEDLRKSSGMKAAKKAGRTAAEGVVVYRAGADNKRGLLLEVNSETDFVARDENFLAFVGEVADKAFADQAESVQALMAGELETKREALVQKIGENTSVRRLQHASADNVGGYVHGNSRIGVVVSLQGGSVELAKDIAMHIAAMSSQFISPADVPEAVVSKERDIYSAQAAESGKPEEIIAKMVEGRVRKYLAEISLTEQAFVKDPDVKISGLLKKADATVLSFTRYEVGEGIEKEEVDFAAEVAAQLSGDA